MCQKIHINLQNIQECMYIYENNLLTNLNISRESYGCTWFQNLYCKYILK